MRSTLSFLAPGALRASLVLLALFAFAGCRSAAPIPALPNTSLELIESSQLELPRDCFASGSFVVSFTVTPSGRTADIHSASGSACVQQALTAWIASFRYLPPSQATPTTLEWLMVTAKRGS